MTQQKTISIDLRAFGGSALTADIAIPHARSLAKMAAEIPITYVPTRNTIFRFHLHAPLLRMSKAEIVRTGIELGVPYAYTWSCYEGGELACGTCDSCLLRLNGFAEAGAQDPIAYLPA